MVVPAPRAWYLPLLVGLLASLAVAEWPVSSPCKPYAAGAARYVHVSNLTALKNALSNAKAGDLIEMEEGTYAHATHDDMGFDKKNGTADQRIVLCGPRTAIVTGNPYNFVVRESSFITLAGFTVTGGTKGVVVEKSSHVTLLSLDVHDTGYEGVRIRFNSEYITVRRCKITNTGRTQPKTGEGIYIGSAEDAYPAPGDRTNNVKVVLNHIGPGVTSEMVDVKEFSYSGTVARNFFDGKDLCGENGSESWVAVKGSGYVFRNNKGINTRADGFILMAKAAPNSGSNNVFYGNQCSMPGSHKDDFCVNVKSGKSNTIGCSNVVKGGSAKVSSTGKCSSK